MEVENQVSFISPMLQKTQFGNIADETTITFKEDADTPMTIDASAPGDVIELSDDFDFDGYQVVRREFFAHTFEPSITFNNYKVKMHGSFGWKANSLKPVRSFESPSLMKCSDS